MRYEVTLDRLRRGNRIRTRKEMSAAFGGTTFRGISYRRETDYVILAAGSPRSRNEFNYRNRWLDEDELEYEFYGEWRGCQDMTMDRGNAAIRDRSPNLYLFIFDEDAYEFQGRFRYLGHETRSTANPSCGNRPFRAIVFRLGRA